VDWERPCLAKPLFVKAVNWESLGLEIIGMIKASAEKAVGLDMFWGWESFEVGRGLGLGSFEVGKVFGRERCDLVKTLEGKGLC